MATRSLIGMKQDDGKIQVIYCHWDGYPEYVGLQLSLNYGEKETVQKLMDLGDRSSLRGAPTEQDTYLVTQGTKIVPTIYDDFQQFLDNDKAGAEYFYLWDNGWDIYKVSFEDTVTLLGRITDYKVKIEKPE
jgi:hypothetical protein